MKTSVYRAFRRSLFKAGSPGYAFLRGQTFVLAKAESWKKPASDEELGKIVPHFTHTEMWPNDRSVRAAMGSDPRVPGSGRFSATEYRSSLHSHYAAHPGGTYGAGYSSTANTTTALLHGAPYHWDVHHPDFQMRRGDVGIDSPGGMQPLHEMYHFPNPHDPEGPGLTYIPLHRGFLGGHTSSAANDYQYQSYQRQNADQHIYSPATWMHAKQVVKDHPEFANNAVQVGPHLMPHRLGELADLPHHLAKMGDRASLALFATHTSEDEAEQRLHHKDAAIQHVNALPEPQHTGSGSAWPVEHMVHVPVSELTPRGATRGHEGLQGGYRHTPDHLASVLNSLAHQTAAYHEGPIAPGRTQRMAPETMSGYFHRSIDDDPSMAKRFHSTDSPAERPEQVAFTHFAPRHYGGSHDDD